jgi:preprotein translocase subunit SecY
VFKTIKNAWSLPDLRKKILFTLLIIVVFRIGSVIQVPFLDTAALRSVMNPDDWSNTMLSYMNTLSGGAFSNATLFAMGITPYINSSIIIQLLCVAIPPLERLAREGEAGRRKISAITRYVTVGLGIIQGTAYYFYLLNSKVTLYNSGFELWFSAIVIILVFTAGTSVNRSTATASETVFPFSFLQVSLLSSHRLSTHSVSTGTLLLTAAHSSSSSYLSG